MGKGALIRSKGIFVLFSLILLSGTVFAVPDAFASVTDITDLTATAVVGGDVDLNWSASTASVPDATVTYRVERSTDNFVSVTTVLIASQTGTTFTDSSGSDGTTYDYRVIPIGDSSGDGNPSNVVQATPDSSVDINSVGIASNNANTALAKSGDDVIVTISSDETLTITAQTIDGQSALASSDGTTVTATRNLDGSETEALLGFSVTVEDSLGNSQTIIAVTDSSTVTADFTAPGALTSVSISSNNANDIALAKSGDTVSIAYILPELDAIVTSVTIGGQAASTANPATLGLDGAGDEGLLTFSIDFTDAAGNPGPTESTVDDASSVTSDFTPPTVLISEDSDTILNSLDTIADDDVTENDVLEVTLTFSEPMSTAPTIAFIADVESSGTLVPQDAGSFDGPSEIFTRIYDLADIGETQAGVDVGISGAADLAGNVQVSNSVSAAFNVDTENPEIAPATLTIVSSNTFDSAFPGEVATDGDTITITLDATEALLTEEADDVTIQGVPDSDADVGVGVSGTTLTASLAVDTDDTEGEVLFSITYRDLVRNLGAPSTPNVPEPATNAHLTIPLQKVVLDYTAPPTVSVSIIGEDIDDLRTFARLVDLDLGCNDDNGPIDVAGCFEYRVVGDELLDTELFVPETTYPATAQTTVTAERGLKTVSVTYVDRAGNTATDTTDTIRLDPFFTEVVFGTAPALLTPANVQGLWEDFEFDISGKITHPQVLLGLQDKVQVDFNYFANAYPTFDFPAGFTHPSNIVVLDITPTTDPDVFTFSTSTLPADSREFPRPSQDQVDIDNLFTHLHTGEATLVEFDGITVVTDSVAAPIDVDGDTSNQAEVLEHPTSIVADFVTDPNEGNRFFAGGRLSDTISTLSVPEKLIAIADNGVTVLPSVITEGITFTDPTEIIIDSCSSVLVCPLPGDNIMRLNVGATIIPSEGATYVALYLRDMGTETVTFRVTNGDSPTTNDFSVTSSPTDITLFTLTDPFDIEQIEIIGLTGSGTVGLSSVKTFGSELGAIHDIDFTSTASGTTLLTFDEGRFYSQGTARSDAQNSLILSQIFAGDDDYATFTATVTYSVLESTTAGVGGGGSVISDGGVGIPSILCSADADNDALCDGWEAAGTGSGAGVPFTVNGVPYNYPLSGTNTGTDNLLFEIDSMQFHTPDATSLTTAVSTLASEVPPVALLYDTGGDTTLTHIPTIGVWTDTDFTDDNDYNSLKNDWFGKVSERPVISLQSAQGSSVITTTSATISGISLGIPNQNTIVPNGGTEGTIVVKTKLTLTPSNEKHRDTGATAGRFDSGEAIYRDVDFSNTVTAGDIRLANPSPFGLNTVVIATDSDVSATPLVAFVSTGTTSELHRDTGATAGRFDSGERIYQDVDISGTVTAGDKRLANPAAGFAVNSVVGAGNSDLITPRSPLVKFAPVVSIGTLPTLSSGVSGFTFQPLTASISSTSATTEKILTINIPFRYIPGSWTPLSTTTIPTFTIPFTSSLSTSNIVSQATNPGSPQVFTTLLNAKAQAYRYGMWAHSYGGPSGQSELKGNDLLVTLGQGFSGTLGGHSGSIGSTNEQTGTFLHEIGHTLNLQHGGGDTINCKPNYFSLMSYSRQLPTYLGGAWTPTFSPGGHSALTETLLPEDPAGAVIILNGLGTETAVYGSPFISPASLTHAIPDHTFHTALGNAEAIDWNDSGAATPALIVSRDVSNFGITGCGATGPTSTSYTDFNDSDLFSFNFRAEPSGQFDGITIFLSDQDDDVFYGTLLAAGQFDGLDSPVPNNKSKKGSSIPLKLDVTIPGTGVVDIIGVHGEVWVSPINDIDGPYVTQLTNHLTGGTDVVWNPVTRQITFVWKTPSNLPLGDYYLRVFLTDPEGGFIGGLAADPDNIPGSGFLTDLVLPYKLPLDLNGAAPPPPQRFEATDKVTIIK